MCRQRVDGARVASVDAPPLQPLKERGSPKLLAIESKFGKLSCAVLLAQDARVSNLMAVKECLLLSHLLQSPHVGTELLQLPAQSLTEVRYPSECQGKHTANMIYLMDLTRWCTSSTAALTRWCTSSNADGLGGPRNVAVQQNPFFFNTKSWSIYQ